MAVNPACAINDAFGVKILNTYTGRTRIGRVPLTSSVVLSGSAVQFVDGVAVAPGATYAWFDEPGARVLVVIQEVDPLDSTLKNSVYIDWTIDLTLVLPSTSAIFQIGHTLNGVAITHCIYMPDADLFVPTFFVGDQANGIHAFTIDDVVGTFTKIITTTGTGVNSGRMTFDPISGKLIFVDARGADTALNIYSADPDGTDIVKISTADISAGLIMDAKDGCMVTSNGRIAYHTTNQKGIMDINGANQNTWSTSNFDKLDMAPTGFTDEVYNVDGDGNPLDHIDYETGSITLIQAAVHTDCVSDRTDYAATVCFYRLGKTIRSIKRDGTAVGEVYDGVDIVGLRILIGIDEGRIYFVYDIAGPEIHIGSVTKAGGDFTDHGRIDNLGYANSNGACATLSHDVN